VFISLADKKNDGQIQLDNIHKHGKLLRPLAVPMVEETSLKVQQLITVPHNEHHINKMTENGFVKHQTRLEFQYFTPLGKSTN